MVPVPVRGFRARLHEQGAMLCSGEGLVGGSNAAQGWRLLAGGFMSVCLPAPLTDHRICCSTGSLESEDTSKAEQSVLEKLREMPPSSLFPSLKAGSLYCCGGVSRAKVNKERKGVVRVVLKCLIPVIYLQQQRTNYA